MGCAEEIELDKWSRGRVRLIALILGEPRRKDERELVGRRRLELVVATIER